ncbi:hypothetical protein HN011_004916 [Eciton burchellii]|nr:hypothetical protein HN011_004916 [Eciton burchellii]
MDKEILILGYEDLEGTNNRAFQNICPEYDLYFFPRAKLTKSSEKTALLPSNTDGPVCAWRLMHFGEERKKKEDQFAWDAFVRGFSIGFSGTIRALLLLTDIQLSCNIAAADRRGLARIFAETFLIFIVDRADELTEDEVRLLKTVHQKPHEKASRRLEDSEDYVIKIQKTDDENTNNATSENKTTEQNRIINEGMVSENRISDIGSRRGDYLFLKLKKSQRSRDK